MARSKSQKPKAESVVEEEEARVTETVAAPAELDMVRLRALRPFADVRKGQILRLPSLAATRLINQGLAWYAPDE
jgi:hypothetical protein